MKLRMVWQNSLPVVNRKSNHQRAFAMKFRRLRKFKEGTEGNPRFQCMEEEEDADNIDVEIHWQVNSDDDEFDGDYDVDTITIEDFTWDNIKAAVEKHLRSEEFPYHNMGRDGYFGNVYFTVQVQLVPYYSDRNTLFAGTYVDGVVDWDEED